MKKLLFFSLLFWIAFTSCQKDADQQNNPSINSSDSVASIVVDGDYGGSFPDKYDSAVLHYSTKGIVINHYGRNSVSRGVEKIYADSTNRIVQYQFINSSNQTTI